MQFGGAVSPVQLGGDRLGVDDELAPARSAGLERARLSFGQNENRKRLVLLAYGLDHRLSRTGERHAVHTDMADEIRIEGENAV